MIIYIDNDYKCHISNMGNLIAIETDFFDDKCSEYIEGYRYVPEGETWTRSDGVKFGGEMVFPWKPLDELRKAQAAYEKEQYEAAIDELLLLI